MSKKTIKWLWTGFVIAFMIAAGIMLTKTNQPLWIYFVAIAGSITFLFVTTYFIKKKLETKEETTEIKEAPHETRIPIS